MNMIKKMELTFLQYLGLMDKISCDLVIGDCDMEYSFEWDNAGDLHLGIEPNILSKEGYEEFKPIFDAPIKILHSGKVIEILCDDVELGDTFSASAAGYCGASYYDLWFHNKQKEE